MLFLKQLASEGGGNDDFHLFFVAMVLPFTGMDASKIVIFTDDVKVRRDRLNFIWKLGC